MRSSIAAITVAISAHNVLTAAPITGAAPSPAGFGSADSSLLLSAGVLSPAAAFSVDMKKAFLTPEGVTLKTGGASARPTRLAPGSGSNVAGRRVRSIIGVVASADSTGGSGSGGGGGGGQNSGSGVVSLVPVPEPGTVLTGLLILGVCANGTRSRRNRK